jgi:hypothetical protein
MVSWQMGCGQRCETFWKSRAHTAPTRQRPPWMQPFAKQFVFLVSARDCLCLLLLNS